MKTRGRFSPEVLAILRERKGLSIRAGNGKHRFIGIWMVMVGDRVFVRSWSIKPDGWYKAFLKEPEGAIRLPDHEIAGRAVRIKSERLRDAVDRAYLVKYNGPSSIKYAKDLGREKSRATTLELVPLA